MRGIILLSLVLILIFISGCVGNMCQYDADCPDGNGCENGLCIYEDDTEEEIDEEVEGTETAGETTKTAEPVEETGTTERTATSSQTKTPEIKWNEEPSKRHALLADTEYVINKWVKSLGWQQTNGPRLEYIRQIQFDPDDMDTLYIVSNTGSGILKSTNRGQTWNKWDEGIENYNVFSIIIDPNNHDTMYAGASSAHIYKSTNRGETWSLSNEGIGGDGIAVWCLAINPDNSNILFAGQADYGRGDIGGSLYKSANAGETWTEVLNPGTNSFIGSITVDEINPNIVYATTGFGDGCNPNLLPESDAHNHGIFKSTDNGDTWNTINNGLNDLTVSRVTIDPRDSNILYATVGCVDHEPTTDYTIYKSTNGGENWQELENSRDNPSTDIEFDDNYNLYTGGYGNSKFGIYKSEDDGQTWNSIVESVNGAFYTFLYDLVIDPRDSDHQYFGTYAGGIYETTDNGLNWFEINGNIDDGVILANSYGFDIDPNNGDILYASTIGGLFKTENSGNTWELVNHELANKDYGMMVHQRNVVINKDSSNIVYAMGDGGTIFRSANYGVTWSEISVEEYTNRLTKDLNNWHHLRDIQGPRTQSDPEVLTPLSEFQVPDAIVVDNKLYIVTYGEENIRLLKYTRPGKLDGEWTNIIGTLTNSEGLYSITHDPQSNKFYIGGDQGKLYKSNTGSSWQTVNNDLTFKTFYNFDSALNGNRVYTGSNGNGPYRSGGGNFESLNAKSYSANRDRLEYTKLIAVDAYNQDNTIAYDATDSRVYKTYETYVEDWQEYELFWEEIFNLNSYDQDDEVLSLDIRDDLVLIGTRNNGLFLSTDSGNSWENINDPLLNNKIIRDVEIDYDNPNKVYIGIGGDEAKLVYSTDQGNSWNRLSDYFTFSTIHEITIDPNNENIVYAAPWGGGLFISENNGEDWEEIETPTISIVSVVVDPTDSNHLIIGDRTKPIIYESYNRGEFWYELISLDEEDYYRVSAMGLHNGELYFSVFNKINGLISLFDLLMNGPMSGTTFRFDGNNVEELGGDLEKIAINFFSDGNDIYAIGHIFNVFKLDGDDWEDISGNLPDIGFNNIIVDDLNNLYVTGASDIDTNGEFRVNGDVTISSEIYKSEDNGNTWNPILGNNLFPSSTKKLLQHPTDENVFIAGTANGIYISSDRGNTWNHESDGLDFENIGSMTIGENYIYVGTGGGGVYSGRINQDYSIDWHESTGPYPFVYNIQIKIDPTNANTLYATAYPGGVFKSTDAGNSWGEANFAMPSFEVPDPEKQGYYSLVINPINPNELFLGTFGKGIYRSDNAAGTWMPLYMVDGLDNDNIYGLFIDNEGRNLYVSTDGQPTMYELNIEDPDELGEHDFKPVEITEDDCVVSDIVVDHSNSDIIYTVASPGGVFKSEDGGDTWHEKTNGVVFGKSITFGVGFEDAFYKLEMNPSDPDMLFLGSYAGDVYVTYDGGDTWQRFENGLARKGSIYGFKFSSDGSILYISQKAGGVSKLVLEQNNELNPWNNVEAALALN